MSRVASCESADSHTGAVVGSRADSRANYTFLKIKSMNINDQPPLGAAAAVCVHPQSKQSLSRFSTHKALASIIIYNNISAAERNTRYCCCCCRDHRKANSRHLADSLVAAALCRLLGRAAAAGLLAAARGLPLAALVLARRLGCRRAPSSSRGRAEEGTDIHTEAVVC